MFRYFACMSVCVPFACLVYAEARRGTSSLGTGVTDGCEVTSGCWEYYLGLWA